MTVTKYIIYSLHRHRLGRLERSHPAIVLFGLSVTSLISEPQSREWTWRELGGSQVLHHACKEKEQTVEVVVHA